MNGGPLGTLWTTRTVLLTGPWQEAFWAERSAWFSWGFCWPKEVSLGFHRVSGSLDFGFSLGFSGLLEFG